MAIVDRNYPKRKEPEEDPLTNLQIKTSPIDDFISVLVQFQVHKRKALKVARWLGLSLGVLLLYLLATLGFPGTQVLLHYLLQLLMDLR